MTKGGSVDFCSMAKRRIYLGIFLISASVLMLELILTRIFSVKLYYHYAFMVISLALLGSGASGVYVYLFPESFRPERLERQLFWASWLFAVSIPLALSLILQLDFQLDFTLRQLSRVFLLYAIPAIPFFLGGFCISLAMTHLSANVSRLYGFDLAGAACGCLLVIPLLNYLGGPQAMLSITLSACLACWLFSSRDSSVTKRWRWLPLLVAAPVFGVLVGFSNHPLLKIKYVKGRIEGEPLFSKWNSFSRITVVQVDNDPQNTWIIMDGDAGTLLPRFDGDLKRWSFLKTRVSSLAYQLKKDAQTLIIGPGGGIDVLTALVFENRRITGVEINPIIVNNVMRGHFREFTGNLYFRPEVQIYVDEARSFIRKTQEQYDIIQATLVDTWAATAAGAFALTENNLYTVEAFKDYFSKLKSDGILTFTRWNLEPPQQDLRLVSLTRSAMQELGIPHPERSIIVVRERRQSEAVACTFLFKKSGFTDHEVKTVEAVSQANSFDLLYTPQTRPNNPFAQLVTTDTPKGFYLDYPYDVSPSRDNRPFFFHTVRLRHVWRSLFLSWESKKTNVGILVLFLVSIAASVLVLVFILVPLCWFRRSAFMARRDLREISYFFCLGFAFILVEMTLIQKFILFLGQPVYALGVVLFSMLLFSGLGSFFSARFFAAPSPQSIRKVCLLLAALVVVYLLALPYFLYHLVGLSMLAKAFLVIALQMPLSFIMGMPMPLGVRRLHHSSVQLIPWAWGMNGSASVLGSILTVLVAVNAGFDEALLTAVGFYILAAALPTYSSTRQGRSAEELPSQNPETWEVKKSEAYLHFNR
jgi:Spermine/spermidine synthase domain